MDAVQKANSGHPGMPMGMADIAVVLWGRYLQGGSRRPGWPDRDRFVLSNGHGSMLLYSLLHLSRVSADSRRPSRTSGNWESHTAGHPEIDHRLGIEVTTGPLGQGFGMGVGMAIAEEHLRGSLRSRPGRPSHLGFVSDGDLMEGVSAEASSLAGHLGLGRLIYFYDDNNISIDGSTDITFSEDVAGVSRRRAGTPEIDGHDREAIAEAIDAALGRGRPALADHLPHPHRSRRPQRPGHGQGPRRAARGRGDRAHQGRRWAGQPSATFFVAPTRSTTSSSQAMDRGGKARGAGTTRAANATDERHAAADSFHGRSRSSSTGPDSKSASQ